LTNSFEGVANGTTLSTGNTGGTSGQAADVVQNDPTCSLVASNSTSAHGNISFYTATGSTAGKSFFEWSTQLGTVTTHYGRAYINPTGTPGSTDSIIEFDDSTGTWAGAIQITNGGKLQIQDASYSYVRTFATTLSAGNWYRVEWQLISSTTVGQMVLSLFNLDSTSALETFTTTAAQNFGSNCKGVKYGWGSGNHANQPGVYIDDVGLSTTGAMGPLVLSNIGSSG